MCRTLSELSQMGQNYWLTDQAAQTDHLLATKIQSSQMKLSEMRLKLEGFISKVATREIVESEQKFQREISGGNFGVHNRLEDIERARRVIYSGQSYETTIRMSRLHDMKGYFGRTKS